MSVQEVLLDSRIVAERLENGAASVIMQRGYVCMAKMGLNLLPAK